MIYLDVPYEQKDEAKTLGARWDADKKKWYVPRGYLATPFERWMPLGEDGPKMKASITQEARSPATGPSAAQGIASRGCGNIWRPVSMTASAIRAREERDLARVAAQTSGVDPSGIKTPKKLSMSKGAIRTRQKRSAAKLVAQQDDAPECGASVKSGVVRGPGGRVDGFASRIIIGVNYKPTEGAVGLPWD